MEPKVTVYIGANAGFIHNAAKDNVKATTVNLGTRIENNGYYATAEGGYGTSVYARAEAGKDFPIKDTKYTFNTSIGGQYTQSTSSRDYYTKKFDADGNSPSWKANDARGYGQVALTYKSPSFKASFGVQGGIKTCTQPSLDGIKLDDIGEVSGTKYQGRTTKGYVTPIVSMEAGKSFKGTLEASLDHLSIGAKLNIFSN